MTRKWLSPPEIANELGCDVSKVLTWIRRAELPAFDLSERKGERPRYKVRAEDWAEFLRHRRVQPPTLRQKRRRKVRQEDSCVPEYV